jgi:ubiquinone/menaquinone biosynthesis C-methylase UbiE
MNIYADDGLVGALTREAFHRTDSKLLQIHRFSASDRLHVKRLLEIFDPVSGCRLADVGCGIGEVSRLMKEERSDLDFILINPGLEQLEMAPDSFEQRVGWAESLPLEYGEVDALMVCYALGHFDVDRFISECDRVLRPGGFLYFYDIFCSPFCTGLAAIGYEPRVLGQLNNDLDQAGFRYVRGKSCNWVPGSIAALMPTPFTLDGAYSMALVYEKGT